ncbi:MAG: hypothetical protein K0R54_4510 [Clostridiaceae bacterium]|jgi:hypothetical protein|nr:hypothetical protein [Clostridiaceae bacterium]
MKYKAPISISLSMIAIISGIYLNFPQFLMGSPANIKNLNVTIAYTIFINMAEIYAAWALLFVILLLTQWYGIQFFINNFQASAIIIAVLSITATVTIKLMLKETKGDV